MLSTKVLPEAVLDRVKRSKSLYALGRRARFSAGAALGARHVSGIGRVHYNDFMLRDTRPETIASYQDNATEFVGLLGDAVASVGKSWMDIRAVLDIGCGYGRIVRALLDRVPPSRIYVCDVIEGGVEFTSKEFGVNRVPLLEHAYFSLHDKFDLAYLLSVYTHTPDGFMANHLRLVNKCLKPGSVCVFTTQGPISANTCERYQQAWLDKDAVLSTLAQLGFCFMQYPHYRETYGMTWCSREYVEKAIADAGLWLVDYKPAGHGGHQDVFVARKG